MGQRLSMQAAIKKDSDDKLKGHVDIDETLVGGYSTAIGRSTETKSAIQTDALHSYKKLANEMENITINYSEKGSIMEELHKQIMQFKNWLRGTHHKCSKEHLFAYTDEYKYRFNRRNMRKWLLMMLIGRLMNQFPHPY